MADKPWDAERIARARARYAALNDELGKLGTLGEERSRAVLVELMGAAKTVPLLLDEVARLRAALSVSTIPHLRVEGDPYFSCEIAQREDADDPSDYPYARCTCTAERHNARIAAALAPRDGAGEGVTQTSGHLSYDEEIAAIRRLQDEQSVPIGGETDAP